MMSAAVNGTTTQTGLADVPPTWGGRLRRVGLWSAAAAGLLAAGLGPLTYRWSGPGGLAAMGAALAISLACNLAGAAPACTALGGSPAGVPKMLLVGMLLRLALLVFLAVPLALALGLQFGIVQCGQDGAALHQASFFDICCEDTRRDFRAHPDLGALDVTAPVDEPCWEWLGREQNDHGIRARGDQDQEEQRRARDQLAPAGRAPP